MRLIDADAIDYTMLYKENWLKGTGVEDRAVWKKTIDEMPTVEAIPIDFIMSQIYVEESVAERTYASFFWRELIELWRALKENWE